jgi:hypothetical protein
MISLLFKGFFLSGWNSSLFDYVGERANQPKNDIANAVIVVTGFNPIFCG